MDRLSWISDSPREHEVATGRTSHGSSRPVPELAPRRAHGDAGRSRHHRQGAAPLRGDRSGIEEFNPRLSAPRRHATLTPPRCEFEDFSRQSTFRPILPELRQTRFERPCRSRDTSHRAIRAGRAAARQRNAQRGLALYRPPRLLDSNVLSCASCHTLPTGLGADARFTNSVFVPFHLTEWRASPWTGVGRRATNVT